MMKLARALKGRATRRSLLCSAALYVVMFAVSNGSFARLMRDTGVQILDTRFGYSPEAAYQALAAMGGAGREAYLHALRLDCVFPLTYMAFLTCLTGFLLGRFVKTDGKWDALLFLPSAAMLLDWTENAMVAAMLRAFPQEALWAGRIGSAATCAKLLLSALSLLAAAGIAVWGLTHRRKEEARRKP